MDLKKEKKGKQTKSMVFLDFFNQGRRKTSPNSSHMGS
jgi:hypothetical protein